MVAGLARSRFDDGDVLERGSTMRRRLGAGSASHIFFKTYESRLNALRIANPYVIS